MSPLFSTLRRAGRLAAARQNLWFEKNYRLQDILLSKSFPSYRARSRSQAQRGSTKTRGRSRPSRREGVVENTGLEPVTSWLQTRRSPS